jgi:hypothetical protein
LPIELFDWLEFGGDFAANMELLDLYSEQLMDRSSGVLVTLRGDLERRFIASLSIYRNVTVD